MSDLVNLYRYLLAVPIVVSLVAYGLVWGRLIDHDSSLLIPALIVMGSLLFGGVPYFICAACIFWYSKNKPESVIRRLYLLYPLGMIAIFAVVLFLDGFVFKKINYLTIAPLKFLPDFINCFLVMSGFTLGFGYFYVLTTFGIMKIVRGFAGRIP